MSLRKSEMYRLPWSLNDNPIGWLEVTDKCNIYCRGCYRLNITGHKPLEQVKEDILFFKEWRNCYNISIAGGEPLLHPDILEIVSFIVENDMKALMLTNGQGLTRELLVALKEAGALGVAFHIDSQQSRPKWKGKNELELMELRQHYAEMVASVPGLYCNFGMTVYHANLQYLPDIVRWANQNIDKVHGLVFICYRTAPEDIGVDYTVGDEVVAADKELGYTGEPSSEIDLTSTDIYRTLSEAIPHYDTAAYLGGTQAHDSIKWLVGVPVGRKGKMYGSLGPRTMEMMQAGYHFFKGTYLTYMKRNRAGKKVLVPALFDPKARQVARSWLGDVARNPLRFFQPLYTQTIGIVQAPDVLEDGRTDMCDSCPDMTVYDGKLVNSCRMDEWRLYGTYVTVQVPTRQEEETEEDLVPAAVP
jgi:hypothetical protein